jgi:phthiocerol/phenolphthiocerol synthesis type-I polyketide synthase C
MSNRFANLSPLQRAYLAIEELQSKLEKAESERSEPIAIIGIGCRYPGGVDSPHTFWPRLRDGFDAITEVPPERWDIDAYYDPDPSRSGKMCTRWGGFLDGVDRFDAAFFNISPREAALMDPQQRFLLEVAAEALEDAGQSSARIAGSRTGVFIGIYNTDYLQFQHQDEVYAAIGNSLGIAVGRLAYTFDLQGPTMLVDTLCSSSLVAVSLACHSLRRRECNLALAGGVNLILSPLSTIMASRLMALAPDGRCKTFDARANGFVRSDGCGVVVLKRLSEAVADGDPIWALVRGAAVNQDGRSTALTAPNVLAQQAVLRQALADANVAPEQVGYVEAHGTGTPLGDPIEIEAMKAVYGRPRADATLCAIGSVKTNLGHSEAAAGIAGLIKAALALKHQTIPPHLNFRELNPRIDLSGTPFVIPTELRQWPAKDGQRRFAAVSSFGLGGTNAHVVLEEAPQAKLEEQKQEAGRSFVLPLSARNPAALRALVQSVHSRLGDAAVSVPDVCYTASLRRTHYEERFAAAGSSIEELQAGLQAFLDRGSAASGQRMKVAFVFSGHGGQHAGMGRELSREEPVFRKTLEACDRALRSYVDWSLCELLERPDDDWQQNIGQTQPAIFAVEAALFELWRSWGIQPHAVVGHSMGEVAAAYAAGVLSLDHAAQIISRRSALLESTRGRGATLLVDLPQSDVERAIANEKALSVAASNGPRSTVVAGDSTAVTDLMGRLQQQNVFCKRVRLDVAVHTSQMESLGPAILAGFEGVTARAGEIPFYSSVHGRALPGVQCGPTYWSENVRRPVQFWKALQNLVSDGHGLFVEVGPHPVLGISISDGLKSLGAEGDVRCSLRRGDPERRAMLETLTALYEQGQSIAWQALFPSGGRHVSLPTYPFQRERYWSDPPPSGNSRWIPALQRDEAPDTHRVLGTHHEVSPSGMFVWDFEPTLQAMPYLSDHRVQGMVVVPAAVFVELASAGGSAVMDGRSGVEQIELQQMLVIRDDAKTLVQLVIQRKGATSAEFRFASRTTGHSGDWTLHAHGVLRLDRAESLPTTPDTTRSQIEERCDEQLPAASYYAALAAAGLEYGPAFQAVADIRRRDGEALARLAVPAAIGDANDDYLLHPALLDGCFQVFAAAVPRDISEDGGLYLPVAVGSVHHYRRASAGELWVHAHVISSADRNAAKVEGDIRVFDRDGEVVAVIQRFTVQRLAPASAAADPAAAWLYTTMWRRQDRTDQQEQAAGTTILLRARGVSGDSRLLLETLAARGEQCVPGPAAALPELLRQARNSSSPLSRVVYLADQSAQAPDPAAAALERCSEFLHVAQTLAQAGFRDAPRLWLLTRGVQTVEAGDDAAALSESALWGLAGTVALEHPEFACGRIDLGITAAADEAEQVADEISAAGKEDQIALRPGGRYVARLVRRSEEPVPERSITRVRAGEQQFRLEIASPGILDNLTLRAAPRRAPGAGEVEIEVQAAGLNFLDVLSAMGLQPGGSEGTIQPGGECAGVVSAVGDGVHDLRVGDAVMAVAPASFARFVIAHQNFVVRKPDALSYEQAATIPIAFLTTYYALHELGRMRRGDRVLIHSASGGTGLAAVQLAQRAGAEIFATAGSEEKRDLLRSLGIPHVMDSRSLAFADEVAAITGGRGVDLILNSLAGEAIDKSLSILAADGRFLEIGKKDIYQDYRLGLLPFRKGLAYFAIDLAGLALRRPEVVGDLFRKLVAKFGEGKLTPLPAKTYPIHDAVSAFHTMAQAKHTGKLVLTLAAAAETPVEIPHQKVTIRSDGTYLIAGGLGGVGLTIVEWLVEQGARSLVLIGRSAPNPAAAEKLDRLRRRGCSIGVVQADVAQADVLQCVLERLDHSAPPIRGVVHAAAVLDDATLMRLDDANFATVFAPKVTGAWNLHRLAGGRPLDFFVLFSSAASVLGSPGQANYAAANAFLDALAHHRRARGQAALSINWGPWAGVGLAAAQENRGQRLAAMGIESIPPAQGAAVFGRLLSDSAAQVAVMPFRLRVWRQLAPATAGLPFFSELLENTNAQKQGATTSKVRAALLSAEPRKRRGLLEDHLTEQIAQVLRTPAARISRDVPFNTLGMDSLMGLELRNRLESSLGVTLQATLVWSHPTIAALTPHLAEKIAVPFEEEAAVITSEEEALADEMTDQDASALLAEKLAGLDEEYRS